MAIAVRKPATAINQMVSDAARIFDIPAEQINTYDHCQSAEEIEFEMYSNFIKKGVPKDRASYLAKNMSKDLWELSL
jgi:hypothetical protein